MKPSNVALGVGLSMVFMGIMAPLPLLIQLGFIAMVPWVTVASLEKKE